MKSTRCYILTALLLAPLAGLHAENTCSPILPARFTQIRTISSAPPVRTAAESLRDFLKARGVDIPMVTADGTNETPVAGTILLGTTADTPLLARWAKEGRLSVAALKSAGDAYEIAVLDAHHLPVGASRSPLQPRAQRDLAAGCPRLARGRFTFAAKESGRPQEGP